MSRAKDGPRLLPSVFLALLPFFGALWVWLSALSFGPVPWPDDSAFYFVARDFFQWPPRWVMLPQAPFEPTYRIFNFNTMPLYPILIGLGRWIGIDGSHGLKFWPLMAWAGSASVLSVWLYRAGLPWLLAALVGAAVILDPGLRWASVLIRPESLIGLFGMILILGLTLGFPESWSRRKWLDPVALLLALGAYAHFNAIHLVAPVVVAVLIQDPKPLRRLFSIGWKTTVYLLPWIVTVLLHPLLFIQQMTTQWQRLQVPNGWLSSVESAIRSVYQDMGLPEPFPNSAIYWAGIGIWVLMILALAGGLLFPLLRKLFKARSPEKGSSLWDLLIPAVSWVASSIWLWHTKPEVWFTFYLHLSTWAFAGVALLVLVRLKAAIPAAALAMLLAAMTALFGWIGAHQASKWSQKVSWHWKTYDSFIDCISRRLEKHYESLGRPETFRVWAPTFPDITVELSRRHPKWEFTRTNDFHDRIPLAMQHGREVEAMVVPEMIAWDERDIDAPWSEHPGIRSVWMDWKGYYLSGFMADPEFKPNRHLCQKGRWQGFIFMKDREILP